MPEPIFIATRKSPLAMKQTEQVLAWLADKFPDREHDILALSTKVDERLNWSLEKRGGIGLFTKELEEALLGERASLAVHSAKDLPTRIQNNLVIAGYLPRARANDILVQQSGVTEVERIASSSPRRRAQVQFMHPGAEWTTIRGNVGTRLRKIAEGHEEIDASLLAAAGLDRLGIESHEGLDFIELSIEECVPAPGQAAIAIQCREADLEVYENLFCEKTKLAVTLEREFLARLGGGCQTPVGAHYDGSQFHIYHPDSGYAAFEIEIGESDAIEAALDKVLNELNLEDS